MSAPERMLAVVVVLVVAAAVESDGWVCNKTPVDSGCSFSHQQRLPIIASPFLSVTPQQVTIAPSTD
jgi:hypothetical protein